MMRPPTSTEPEVMFSCLDLFVFQFKILESVQANELFSLSVFLTMFLFCLFNHNPSSGCTWNCFILYIMGFGGSGGFETMPFLDS